MTQDTADRLKRVDGFFVWEGDHYNYYLPEDFMTPAQAEAYLVQFHSTWACINQQMHTLTRADLHYLGRGVS